MKNLHLFWLFIIVLLLQSCSTTHHNVFSLKQNTYYSTRINHQDYIITIDTVIENRKLKSPSKFEGVAREAKRSSLSATAYLIDTNEFTTPQLFQVNYKKRKEKGFLNGKNIKIPHTFIDYVPPVITEFPRRYLDSLFSTRVYKDVPFAKVVGYWDSKSIPEEHVGKVLLKNIISTVNRELNLKMDIYVPEHAGKIERPLLMLIHGGAFYVGDKAKKEYVEMGHYFASLGYITASINYRLGFQPSKASIERAGYTALQDAHAALRFLVANAKKYNIDPDNIFVGGSSAGGITALNLAFMQNKDRPASSFKSLLYKDLGDIESVGHHRDATFQIKAIASLWGAVGDLNMLKNNNISVLSYHGTKDPIVPFEYDYPMQKMVKKFAPVFFSKMHGSKLIHAELKKLGYREKLIPVNTDAHSIWETNGKTNDFFHQIIGNMAYFFYKDLVPNPVEIEHDPVFRQRYFISNTKDIDLTTWQCEGCFITNINKNEVFVIWKADATDKKLITSGVYKNGAAFKTEIKK
ncbi:MAG: alpha/beta hydrolase [Lentimicrobiaceae bacterium]|nr:alpha/beta hydrolase [Lentimicrobiaceae bacterium]